MTQLDEDPFSDPVQLQDVIDAAHRPNLRPDKNWSNGRKRSRCDVSPPATEVMQV